MNFSVIYPNYYNELTDTSVPENQDVKYTVSVTPAAVEYSFPLNQERVVRKLMEISEPINFTVAPIKEEMAEMYVDQSKELVEKFPMLQHYWPLRSVYMNSLQDRSFSIEKRMLLINYMCKTIQSMIEDGNEKDIPGLVNFFFTKGDRNEIMQIFSDVTPQFEYSVVDALAMLRSMPSTKEFDEVRNTVFDKLGYKVDFSNLKEVKFADIKDKYLDMKKYFFADYIKQGKKDSREYMLENIMCGYVWELCEPFSDCTSDLWENFIFFNTLFNTLKVMLTVYVTKENGDDGFVKAVTAFDDSLSHVENAFRGGLVKSTVNIIKKRGYVTPNHMAALSLS